MHILKVRYRTNAEFLEAYQSQLVGGGLFCPTTTRLEEGAEVICEITVPALPNKVLVRAAVRAWRPAVPRMRVRAGAVVEFLSDEMEKKNFILDTVRGERKPPARRRHTRLPVELPVRYRLLGTPDFIEGGLSEISVGGALLRADGPLAIGTELVIEIIPPGAVSALAISGKVSYHGPVGASGVKFQYRDGGGSRRLRELIRRLRLA